MLVLVEHWRVICASDRLIDELARGLPYDDPALNDDLVRMLDAWAYEERVRLIRACFAAVDTPSDRVEP